VGPYRTLAMAVSDGDPRLSLGVSHPTNQAAYELFTPNESGQRSLPTYYRGCWHVVGRSFFCRYRHHRPCSKEVYNPKAFIPHAALLRQAFAHCARFPTAASRRSLGRVSVPVWLIVLSDQLPVVALVGRYPTNKLIGREPLPKQLTTYVMAFSSPDHAARWGHPVLATVSRCYPGLRGRLLTCYSPVRH
jgi:hypothetical protein